VLKILKKIALNIGANSPDYFVPIVMAILVVFTLIIPIILTNKYLPTMTGKNKILSKNLSE